MAKKEVPAVRNESRRIIRAVLRMIAEEATEAAELMARQEGAEVAAVANTALTLVLGKHARQIERGTSGLILKAIEGE